MTKRVATDKPVQRPFSTTWPPECPECVVRNEAGDVIGPGWRGEPNDQQSPWLACGGVQANHIRKPIQKVAS